MAKPFHMMPGPPCYPIVGTLLQYTVFGPYSYERLHVAKRENAKRFGMIYRERLGPLANMVQIFDPESAGEVLRQEGRYPYRPPVPITLAAYRREGIMLGLGSMNGPDWYRIRSTLQQLMMRPGAASVYIRLQSAVADDFLDMIEASLNADGRVSDLRQMLHKYTMESIGVVCYNRRLGCLKETLAENSVGYRMLASTSKMFDAVQRTMFSFPWYNIFRSPLYKQFVNAKKDCDSLAMSFIEDMQFDINKRGNDVDVEPNFLTSLIALNKLDLERVVAVTNELFIAGIDSTANALGFVLYNLARNPEKQELLIAEIENTMKTSSRDHAKASTSATSSLKSNDDVTQEMIDRMPLLKACVKESFRLNFPIEGGTIRVLDKDIELNGYIIPRGTLHIINNQTMCMQKEYFDQPDKYIPERWLKTGDSTLKRPPPFAMLPFGYGARMCIGRRFAEQEIYLALIKILSRFRMAYDGEEIGMLNRVFTVPDRPLQIQFTTRK